MFMLIYYIVKFVINSSDFNLMVIYFKKVIKNWFNEHNLGPF